MYITFALFSIFPSTIIFEKPVYPTVPKQYLTLETAIAYLSHTLR